MSDKPLPQLLTALEAERAKVTRLEAERAKVTRLVEGLTVISQAQAVTSGAQNIHTIWKIAERARALLTEIKETDHE